MTPAPWADPELTSRGRLPMHAVPARRPPAARRSLAVPAAPPARRGAGAGLGRGRRPRLLDDAGHLGPPDLHQRPDAVPASAARHARGEPDRRLRALVRGAGAWAGRRVVLHVGAAESVLLVELNGGEVGISKDSHLAAEFDVTAFLRPGANDLRLTVVKWSDASFVEDQDQWWHGGHHATRVPVRDRPGVPRGPGDRRRPRGRRVDRHAVARGRRRLGRPTARTGLAGRGDDRGRSTSHSARSCAHAPPPPGRPGDWVVPGPPRRGDPRSPEPSRRRRAQRSRRRRPMARGRAGHPAAAGRAGPPGGARPGHRALVGGGPDAVRPGGHAVAPDGSRRGAGGAADRLPARRGPRRRAAGQRAGRAHPRRQPPRLRPPHGPRRRRRGRLRADVDRDEALGLQRRADVALPQRPRVPRRCATSSGCT